jgi:hypothetical protein
MIDLLKLIETFAAWASNDRFINLVRTDRRYGFDPAFPDPITLLRNYVANQEHCSLVIRTGARSDFF